MYSMYRVDQSGQLSTLNLKKYTVKFQMIASERHTSQ
jgi:hypothetical protein